MGSLTDWLICGLMTFFFRLFDWLIDWLFIWLTDCLFDWLTELLMCVLWKQCQNTLTDGQFIYFVSIGYCLFFHLLESLATLSGCQRVWCWDPAAARTPGGAEQVTRGEAGELSDAARHRRHPWWWHWEDDGTQTEGMHCFAWIRSAFVTDISWANLRLLFTGRAWTNIKFKAKEVLLLHKYW